jgi:hypothetical protein
MAHGTWPEHRKEDSILLVAHALRTPNAGQRWQTGAAEVHGWLITHNTPYYYTKMNEVQFIPKNLNF